VGWVEVTACSITRCCENVLAPVPAVHGGVVGVTRRPSKTRFCDYLSSVSPRVSSAVFGCCLLQTGRFWVGFPAQDPEAHMSVLPCEGKSSNNVASKNWTNISAVPSSMNTFPMRTEAGNRQ
jgi:hypothetical protein